MTQLDSHSARIIAFIERYRRQHHRSPSYQEIGTALGIASKDHVSRDLRRLRQMGFITFTPRVSRSIVLVKRLSRQEKRRAAMPLPFLDPSLSNGFSAPIPESGTFDLARIAGELVADEPGTHLLRVEGESMTDALVHDGDLVVLKRSKYAQNGEFAAVWIRPEKKLGLKYYQVEGGRVCLSPANPELPSRYYRPDEIEIRGQVLAVIRST